MEVGCVHQVPLVFKYYGHLIECIIRLKYAPFLTTITFRRVGSALGPTPCIPNYVIYMVVVVVFFFFFFVIRNHVYY